MMFTSIAVMLKLSQLLSPETHRGFLLKYQHRASYSKNINR